MDIELKVNASITQALGQHLNEIRIESLKRTRSTMNDRHLCACNCGHVRELHRNISAAYKDDAGRQYIQIEELITDRDELFSRNAQRGRFHAYSYHDVPGFEYFAADFDRVRTCEARLRVERRDTCLAETVFSCLWRGFRKRAFESH